MTNRVLVLAVLFAVTTFAELSGSAAATSKQPTALEPQRVAVDAPIDFKSLRTRADAMAAGYDRAFKLHQAEALFVGPAHRIEAATFHYSRPSPARGGPAAGWDELVVKVTTPRQIGTPTRPRSEPGRISADERREFADPRPVAAPSNFLPPEDVLRRLNREPLHTPDGSHRLPRSLDARKVNLQLFKVGAPYQPGSVGPKWPGAPVGNDQIFFSTAPKGEWVWWTIAQRPGPGLPLEYLYVGAVSGRATSHCGEGRGKHVEPGACSRTQP